MKRFIQLFSTLRSLSLCFFIAFAVSAQQSVNQKPAEQKAVTKPGVQAVQPSATIPKPAPPPPNCGAPMVPIPPAAQDHAPIITINAVASGGSGQIQYPEASPATCPSPCQNQVTLNTDLVVVVHAKNPGGVKNIGLTVKPPDGPAYNVERTASPNANNCVYPSLSILGHNGAGGIGGNPILFHMKQSTSRATVLARATNFNGQSSLYAVTYYVKTSPPPSNPPPTQGCLVVTYHFTWGSYPATLAGQELPIKIHWQGVFKGKPVPKSKARTSFDLTETYKVSYPYSPTWTGVNESISNLMPGLWSVSAQYISGLGGLKHYNTPITCTGTVPGGPRCGTIGFNHDDQTCIKP